MPISLAYPIIDTRAAPRRRHGTRAGGAHSFHLPLTLTAVLFLPSLLVPSHSAAAIFTVGPGGDCSTSTLNGAIVGASFTINGEADEIRLTQDLTGINRELRNWDPASTGELTIRGGFANCSAAAPTVGARTAITGNGTDAVFEVVADGASSVVTFEQLAVSAGLSAARAVTIDGAADVTFLDTELHTSGGGLLTAGPATVLLDASSEVHSNTGATPGGGISCSGSTMRIQATIYENTTTSSGGGLFVDAGCTVRLMKDVAVYDNEAGWGGGIAVSSGSRLLPDLAEPGRAVIFTNRADHDGGGVYVVNDGEAELVNSLVVANLAQERGGGLFADLSSVVRMLVDPSTCSAPALAACSRLDLNRAGGATGEGLAAYFGDTSAGVIAQTTVKGNRSLLAEPIGGPLFVSGPFSNVILEGIEVAKNSTELLFDARGGTFTVAYASAAANESGSPTPLPAAGGVADDAALTIYSSALADHGGFSTSGFGTVDADCLVAETLTGLSSATRSTVADPLFADPDSADLRLLDASPAIDYCDTSAYIPSNAGIDLLPRGYDQASVADLHGPYDLGAFESGQALFADGFESGDTSPWTATSR